MIEVSDLFKTMAQKYYRNVDFKIVSNDDESTVYSGDVILECQINRSVGSSGIQIGNAISDRLQFTLKSTDKIKSGTRLTPYVRYTGDENTEWLRLGRFYCTESKMSNGVMTVTAYDKLYNFDKRCAFGGKGDVQALSFPATHQQMWDYVCALRGVSTDFQCADFTVAERPLANPNANDDSKYYTQRQIIGMIAACNAGNAVIDNNGKLTVRRFANQTYTLNKNRCFTQEIDTAEQFQVKGILFHVDSENDIFIDDNASEYSEDREGIIVCDNALATVGVAEYVWNKLGNLKYSGCEITRRGVGWLETGETLQVEDFYDAEGGAVNVITSEIDYKFSYDNGFTETIRSVAETAEQSGNRAVASGTSGTTTVNTTEKFSSFAANSDGSYTVNGVNYKPFFNKAGKITTISDSKGNVITTAPTYAEANSNIDFNTMFMTLAAFGMDKSPNQDYSIFTFEITDDDLTLTIPALSSVSLTGQIDWDDGEIEDYNPMSAVTHNYSEAGTYQVKITAAIKTLKEGSTSDITSKCVSVLLGDSIESIYSYYGHNSVFTGCKKLSYFRCGAKLNFIGVGAFNGCTALQTFVFPTNSSITFGIGRNDYSSTFCNCTALKNVAINSVASIPKYFFVKCSALGSVYIPKTVKSIDYLAFSECGSIVINYQGTEAEWNAITKVSGWNSNTVITEINYNQAQ